MCQTLCEALQVTGHSQYDLCSHGAYSLVRELDNQQIHD